MEKAHYTDDAAESSQTRLVWLRITYDLAGGAAMSYWNRHWH